MYFVLRTETFARLFFFISCAGLFLYAILAFYTFHVAYTTMGQVQKPQFFTNIPTLDIEFTNDFELDNDNDLKSILFWTHTEYDDSSNTIPEGQKIFIDHRCDYANCFITTNKTMIKNDYSNFDAIVFNISVIKNWKKLNMPQKRSPKQKYIFYSLQSSDESPVCTLNADNYFNWTWTYKLNSDIVSPFIEVTDLKGNVMAPKLNVDWLTNVSLLMDDKIPPKIKQKRKTMAWVMSKCNGSKERDGFIRELQAECKVNLLDFDIYGCGNLPCSGECLQVISKYYFYLVYEDSIAEDYVTKEVIKAFTYGAVPVILGGADYQKFLPERSYINAQSMVADYVAAKIGYITRNPYVYHSYFTWKKFYSIHETEEFKGICDLCANLNDERKSASFSVYTHFRKWWYPKPLNDKCIPKGAENLAEVLAYINSSVHLK